eukprot:EG_transcript_54286
MAVALTPEALEAFRDAHAGDVYDVQRAPVAHFNDLFVTLFAVRHAGLRRNPAIPLRLLRHFLQRLRTQLWWFRHRLRWFLWARRTAAAFLRRAAAERRARLRR